MEQAVASMTMLNKSASHICHSYEIHACTDVTGFGFLGHLHEMMDGKLSCRIFADQIPVIKEALDYADEFLLTAAGQKNRNHVANLYHLKMYRLPWRKCCLTRRLPEDF